MNITTGSGISVQNESLTCKQIDTPLPRDRSLIVLARQIATRTDLTPHKRRLASTLLQQTYSYDANPEAMRPRILETIERIQTAA
jgi:hypothetical protein